MDPAWEAETLAESGVNSVGGRRDCRSESDGRSVRGVCKGVGGGLRVGESAASVPVDIKIK